MTFAVDHYILDTVYDAIHDLAEDVSRESECVEFRDAVGLRYEIVVRPIDEE